MNRKQIAIGAGILLVFVSVAVWATNARIVWTPSEFKPFSIAPGESVSETVSFKNTGPSMINAKKLELRVNGDARRLVTVGSVSLPKTIKKGMSISVPLTIVASSPEPRGVVRGGLVLLDVHPNGSVREIFSNTLSIEITVSTIPLPPDPGEEGKKTLGGIDLNTNGVRDDIERAIVFRFPDSEKKRAAFMEIARREQIFLLDDYPEGEVGKMKAWTNRAMKVKADYCDDFLSGLENPGTPYEEMERVHHIRKEFYVLFLNTPDRARQHNNALGRRGGKASERTPANNAEFRQQCLDVGINPDSFAN